MGFSTGQRHSTANLLTSTVGRKSNANPLLTSTPANALKLQESVQRRSSVYSQRPSAGFGPAGHQSFFTTAPQPTGNPVDPRRLKDNATKAQIGQELLEFLSQRNFELEMKHTLTQKAMVSPTQKDFEKMFQFLYRCIDPSYRFQKSIDFEGPFLLKQLRYPFERLISKSQWAAAGSNQWGLFLGVLHWLMQLSKMMESYSTGAYDDACIDSGYDVTADRITFQFLSDAYKEWLSIEDDDDDEEEAKRRIEPHVRAMAAKFEQANEANLEQIKMLEAESQALQAQIDELSKSAPVLAKLDETMKALEGDRGKFEDFNQQMEQKIEKYVHREELLQKELVKCEQEMREAEEERDELQSKVDEQGLSVQDIDRRNTERERLQKSAEVTAVKLEEAKERTSKREAEAGGKLDDLESSVQRYNSLAYQISLIPSTALNAHGYDYDLQLNVNAGPDFTASQLGTSRQQNLEEVDRLLADLENGYTTPHLLRKDLRETKRKLQDLRKEISERRNSALEDDMGKKNMLEKVEEELDNKANEMAALEHRQRAAKEEFEKTKEITNALSMASDTQIERMEKELARMRAELSESVHVVEQREMNTNIEYVH